MKRLTVRETMTSRVLTVGPCTSFTSIARLLAERRLNAVPVVENDTLIGVVSIADLLHKEAHRAPHVGRAFGHRARVSRKKAAGTHAAQLMTAPPETIGPDATLVAAAKTMARRQVRQLPVVEDNGRLVGIISRRDLIGALVRPDDAIRDEILHELRVTRTPWTRLDRITVAVHDGVATLAGDLQRRSEVCAAVRVTSRVTGVADIYNALTYTVDDTSAAYPIF